MAVNLDTPRDRSSVSPVLSAPDSDAAPLTEAEFPALPSELDLSSGERESRAGRGLPPALEDTVLSHAAGQDGEALRCIEAALAGNLPVNWQRSAWLMRFELYRELGMQKSFDEAAATFSRRFGRAVPAWQHRGVARMDPASGVPRVAIKGFLSSASQRPLSALRKSVRRYGGVQLDLEKITGIDDKGARALLVTLQSLRRLGLMVELARPERLSGLLHAKIGEGTGAGEAICWLLLLQVLELSGDVEQFAALAARYAAIFAVPAPVLVPVEGNSRDRAGDPGPAMRDDTPLFRLEGVIVRPASAVLAALEAWVASQTSVVIDASMLTRIDYISCSKLMNVLSRAEQAGQRIEIRGPGELVSGLFEMTGVAQVARIVPR
jgi:ABC-type transporter Mla MlaB component